MSEVSSTEGQQTWEAMDFAELVAASTRMMESIRQQVDALATLTPILRRKGQEVGLPVEPDYSSLVDSVRRLAGNQLGNKPNPGAPVSRNPNAKGGAQYAVVWKDSGQPVMDGRKPLRFKNKISILRGERYERLIGDRIDEVQLVDTQDDDRVAVETLTLGPAPPGRPGNG